MAKSRRGKGPKTAEKEAAKTEEATLTGAAGEDSIRSDEDSTAMPVPDSDAASVPDSDAASVPDDDTASVPGDDTASVPDDDTASVPDDTPPLGDILAADAAETATADDDTVTPGDATNSVALEASPDHTTGPEDDRLAEDGADVAATEEDDTVGEDSAGAEPGMTEQDLPAVAAAPQVIEKTVVERKGGFGAMLLGGVVAAALGYGAGAWPDLPFIGGPAEEDPFRAETSAALEAQADQLAQLSAQADRTADAVAGIDLGPLESGLAAVQGGLSDLDARLAAQGDDLAAFGARLTEVEKQPMTESVSPEAIAAYERELQALRDAMAEQQAMLDAQREEIQTMAKDAVAAEASADAKAELAESNAALADVLARVQDGRPYAEPLAVLSDNGVAVPEALAVSAADGVPTANALAETFPDAARAALTVARRETAEAGDSNALTSFFQNQLGARSVTPREGGDPDAVLSRAEAAAKAGDLDTALAELAALPEAAQAALSGWIAQAELRRDALSAAQGLAQELNKGSN